MFFPKLRVSDNGNSQEGYLFLLLCDFSDLLCCTFFFFLYLLIVHVSCIFLSRIYLRPFHRLLLSSRMLEAYNSGIIQGRTHPPQLLQGRAAKFLFWMNFLSKDFISHIYGKLHYLSPFISLFNQQTSPPETDSVVILLLCPFALKV